MTTELVSTNGMEVIRCELPNDRNPAAVYLARLAAGSRRTMTAALETIARLLTGDRLGHREITWGSVRYQHAQAVRAVLAEKYAPATANKHLAALRGVLQEAWRLEQMSSDDFRRTVDVACISGQRLPAGRELTVGEIHALFTACADEKSPAGARDAALLALLYGGGLRRSEVVALDLADYDAATGAVRILGGKGRKDRIVYATNGGRAAIDAWLVLRGGDAGALLCPVVKGGRIEVRRMCDQSIYDRLESIGARASVKNFSPHDFRRTHISHLLDKGADLATVKKLAGHSSPVTTERYDRRGEDTKRRAAELLHVPYVG